MIRKAGVSTEKSIKWSLALIAFLLLTGCSKSKAEQLHGFNFLQSEAVTLDRPAAVDSMRQMQQLGANSIVFVPFFRQGRTNSAEIGFSDAVTERQLISAIREARSLGLKVILKPQILVDGGWPGQIKFSKDINMQRWFARYQVLLLYYAKIAEEEGVSAFVIGTELDGLESASYWPQLIAAIRQVFHGTLTYAAHGVTGIHRFPAWGSLDAVAVTLYPALGAGDDKEQMKMHIDATLISLNDATKSLHKPVWIMEIGIPSVQGGTLQPWEWMSLRNSNKLPDTDTQATAISLWLDQLALQPVEGLFFWCWYSDPNAGGVKDIDYTLQNKPAADIIRCHWTGQCGQALGSK
jgi:hypothetical protein